jgi:putative peptide zinc metalloprotease protein
VKTKADSGGPRAARFRPQKDAADGGERPLLAPGTELLGEYEDSGMKEPPYVVRRADGQVIQIPELLYLIAEQADGRRDYAEIAESVTERFGRGVSADNVRFLVDKKLRPIGVLAQADGSAPRFKKADPLLALRLRTAVIPERFVNAVSALFSPLFFPPVVVAALAGLIAFDVWFFFMHGAAQGVREILYRPLLALVLLGLVIAGTAFHEIGHAAAARYGGARPGVMGMGIYVVWPAFYTDVTDAYRLGRGGRVRTDLGGVYFNALFVLGVAAAYFATGFEALLVLVIVLHLQVVQQFLPFLRLDGYYVLADLTGVPDLFSRIKPTLKSALPGAQTEERVAELKPWVRVITTAWVVTFLPVVLLVFGIVIFNAPRIVGTAWDSLLVQKDAFSVAWDDGRAGEGTLAAVRSGFLVLPIVGLGYSFGRVGSRMVSGAWSWSEGAPVRRGLVGLVATAAVGAGAYVLVPNGDYVPIQPGERGTIQGAVAEFRQVSSGRPALTEERERELGEIVKEHEQQRPTRNEPQEEQPTQPQGTTTTDTTTTETTTTETTTTTTETTTTETTTTTTP